MPAELTVLSEERLLACVHCGLCLQACPTYIETGIEAESPRGRIYLMKALVEGRIELDETLVGHLDRCLGCRACETACPSGVEYGLLIERARSLTEDSACRPAAGRLWRRWLARVLPDPQRLQWIVPVVGLAHRLGVSRLATASWVPKKVRRLAALLPNPSTARLPPRVEPEGAPLGTVALLTGCVTRVLFPHLNEWSARLLALAGYRVVVPTRQVCCGALLAHLGDAEGAARQARKNVNVFSLAEADWIATNAAGCGATMQSYGSALAEDGEFAAAAARIADRVRDVSVLLVQGRLPPVRSLRSLRLAYHDACHLAHGQGVRQEPRELLGSIPGIELVEIPGPELCCGSAGTYNLTEPDMAWRLGSRRAQAILESGAEAVAAANPGCILQIRAALRLQGTDLPVLHPVEILAAAYGWS
jgi:glycolate oxidase iron-sulfur subunit